MLSIELNFEEIVSFKIILLEYYENLFNRMVTCLEYYDHESFRAYVVEDLERQRDLISGLLLKIGYDVKKGSYT